MLFSLPGKRARQDPQSLGLVVDVCPHLHLAHARWCCSVIQLEDATSSFQILSRKGRKGREKEKERSEEYELVLVSLNPRSRGACLQVDLS